MATKRANAPLITKPTTKPTPKQQRILNVAAEHPELSTREIAKIADTDHTHVSKTLQRYQVDAGNVADYKSGRADILAGIQHRLLSSITDEDIKKAPIGTRILATAQLYDKERLERGKSTSNHSILFSVVETACQTRSEVDPTPDAG